MKTPLRISFLVFLSLLLLAPLSAQSPYQLSSGVDIPSLGGGASLLSTSFIIGGKSSPFGPEDTDKLRAPKINFLDRIDPKVTTRFDQGAGHTSDYFLYGGYALPFLAPLLAGNASRHKMGVSYLIVFEGILINTALTNLTKVTVKRPRPYAFGRVPDDVLSKSVLYRKKTLRSFFSGHTSIVACNSFLTAKMLNDFYPDSKFKPALWATATVLPAITGYLRMKAGRHFFTDVLVGGIVGAAVGIIIPELHKL